MEKEKPIIEFLTENYDSLLKITIMMVHDLNAAQDVLQNAAVSIYSKRDSLDDITNPRAYLFTCLRNAALNYIRDSARSLPTDPIELEQMRCDPKYTVAFDQAEWKIVLRKLLHGYAEELTEAFIDHYVERYPLENVAFKLGITTNALSQQFKRMRMRIAKRSPTMTLYILIMAIR